MPQPALDTHTEVRKLKQAGCPEEQAEAMVELVSRAPLNAQIARTLEQMQFRLDSIEAGMAHMATKSAFEPVQLRLESIEAGMANMATKSALEAVQLRVESIKATMANMANRDQIKNMATRDQIKNMATKSDLEVLRAETKAGLAGLRAEMSRMIWIQSGLLGTLILGLATIMVGLALSL